MKIFLDNDFLLHTKTSQVLFHDYAKSLPIIDYHNHLPPAQIAANHRFENITQAWLYGDHYKWRAMRANGINESYITGSKSDYEKFEQWATTVPYTLRNPLYHWVHLELQRYFDVYELLSPANGKIIYHECSAKLNQPDYAVQGLLHKMNVEMVCTTDDPIDDLSFHQQIAANPFGITVLPAFRPDKAMAVDDAEGFNKYIDRLQDASGISINNSDTLLAALEKRMDFFAENGCLLSDHGIDKPYAYSYTQNEIDEIFIKARTLKQVTVDETAKFKSAILFELAKMYHARGWVQQYHIGAIRNNNARALQQLGIDTGFDSIGSNIQATNLSKFLSNLAKEDKLAKTVLYNLNPADNAMMATMAGNFNDGTVPGKIQWGSAWWFLDQKEGMQDQINTLSNMGLLSRFIGMLTDSRSFLSFPRHEYFRRILCNIFGDEMEKGELPNDVKWVGQLIQNICYNNVKSYIQPPPYLPL